MSGIKERGGRRSCLDSHTESEEAGSNGRTNTGGEGVAHMSQD